jgi:dTDP-4-dehydrorhamnose reductase/dTDP-4-dehydrorhamnose 3,5-epimerase
MKVTPTEFKGLYIIETDVYGDHRGWFTETYTKSKFNEHNINFDFVQDNQSFSKEKGTLRGIHFQNNPMAQTKMIRCTRGEIIDTVVDLRRGSDTYLKSYSVNLSAENKKQFLIPRGFGHSFLTITDDVEVQYKVDQYYSKDHDRSINYNDPTLHIDWKVNNPILSEKDNNAPYLNDSDYNFSIKVLVTGYNGQLGYDVVKQLKDLNIEVKGVDINDFDLTDKESVQKYIFDYCPDVIIHCAAYTAVDKAESNKEICYDINVNGTKYIAEIAKKIGSKLVYISTDYVFNGKGEKPHEINELINPINYYGYTKAEGEKLVLNNLENYYIIRTSWVYGINGNNFVKTMLNLSKTKKELSIVGDQIGVPTYTVDLAKFIVELIQTKKYGIYHGVNDGYCSWAEFAKEIFKLTNKNILVNTITSEEYPTPATRPLNSRLSKLEITKQGFKLFPEWKDALARYLKELEEGDLL